MTMAYGIEHMNAAGPRGDAVHTHWEGVASRGFGQHGQEGTEAARERGVQSRRDIWIIPGGGIFLRRIL
jgi:hypothetical protein